MQLRVEEPRAEAAIATRSTMQGRRSTHGDLAVRDAQREAAVSRTVLDDDPGSGSA
jgi:hypothetical protein